MSGGHPEGSRRLYCLVTGCAGFIGSHLTESLLADFVSECDAILHLAAEPGVRPRCGQRLEACVRNNVLTTQALSPYSATELRGEHLCGDVRSTSADTSRARRELSYRPEVAFADGLPAEFEWLLEANVPAS